MRRERLERKYLKLSCAVDSFREPTPIKKTQIKSLKRKKHYSGSLSRNNRSKTSRFFRMAPRAIRLRKGFLTEAIICSSSSIFFNRFGYTFSKKKTRQAWEKNQILHKFITFFLFCRSHSIKRTRHYQKIFGKANNILKKNSFLGMASLLYENIESYKCFFVKIRSYFLKHSLVTHRTVLSRKISRLRKI